MNISAWAIKKPVPIILLFILLTIVGLFSYPRLGIDDNPNVDFPLIVVSVGQAGASPSELETEVTRKVEDAVVGITNLDHIRSTVVDGLSTTVLEFKVGASSETALNDVRDVISRIRSNLPADISEPAITHPNFSGEPFATYAVSSDKQSVAQLSRLVDDEITRAMTAVPGVGQVRRAGGLDREIRVELDPVRLKAFATTADYVNSQIRALNVNLPGGRAEVGGQEQGIRTLGSTRSLDDLRAARIALPSGNFVRLDALGTVQDTYAEVSQRALLNGKPVVGFSVIRAQGAPIVESEEAVARAVSALRLTLPQDVSIDLIRTRANYTRAAYHASIDALVMGALLAIVVIFIFLRSWQATLISAFAIPLSIIATFWIMKTLGYTLNGITLLGLTLVVGILVDDAIVDLENIHRHMTMGKSPLKAALEATEEIGLAVVATTLTIVAVFIPVAFMGGIVGQFFRSFGITVSVSVLFSLLVARTLTPLMAAHWLPQGQGESHHEPGYQRIYLKILEKALSHRWITAVIATVIFVASLAVVPLIPKGLMATGDVGEAMVSISLPSGSTIDETDEVVHAVSRLMQGRSEVDRVFATIGSSGSGLVGAAGSVTTGMVYVVLKPKHERKLSLNGFEDALRPELAKIPGARIAFQQFGATGSPKPVNIILRGTEPNALLDVGDKLLGAMRALPELRDVTSSAAELRPEVHIRPNLARCAEQGVSVATIARVARLATQGDSELNLAKFNTDGRQISIRVQLKESAKQDIQALSSLMVSGRLGLVPLSSVADVTLSSGPVQIDRYERARQVTLTANLTAGNMGAAIGKINAQPAMQNLPATVSKDTIGESKVMVDVFTAFGIALGTAVLFIYAVLVLLFGSFVTPITIMMALPLSIGGALLGLLVGGKELGMMALIGIVMLMGLVTKNSILLVEYTIMARRSGLDRRSALMQAGRDRLRPILMTTIAMIAGMMPIALALGEGTERLSPMAVGVIGGLITSTLLTLVVVPAAYTVVDDVFCFLKRLLSRIGDRAAHRRESASTATRP